MSQATIIIKTIHRPWACARLIQSVRRHAPGFPIHVLDDGRPDYRLSDRQPDAAAMVDRLIETEFDIGLSAGRNRLLETVQTPYVFLCDDDHVFTKQTRFPDLVAAIADPATAADLIGMTQTGTRRQHRCFDRRGTVLRICRQFHDDHHDLKFCDLVPNTFIARTDALRAVGWDERLKVFEHWEFFYRASLSKQLRVAISENHRIAHRHERNRRYTRLRNRRGYLRLGLRKHGLKKLTWVK